MARIVSAPSNDELVQVSRAQLEKFSGYSESKPASYGDSVDELIHIAPATHQALDSTGRAFATFEREGHQETWPLLAQEFQNWLSYEFHKKCNTAPSKSALADASGVLSDKAQFDRAQCPVFTRVAEAEGNIYIDLANETWEAIKIEPSGWHKVSNPPVKFRRSRGMRPLPIPVEGGHIDELTTFLNVAPEQLPLLIGGLIGAFRPTGPYPIIMLQGEQGSAKSTTARVVRSLIDPNASPLRSAPKDARDLMIAATNSWFLAFDNLSQLPNWLCDALCRLATGGGFSCRELYQDASEVIFEAKRPLLLNGIEGITTRSDLLDRALAIELPVISSRRLESDFWHDFDAARPRIFGTLLTVVASALAALPTTRLVHPPRMADFATWVTAAENGVGWPSGSFMAAYKSNQRQTNDAVLDAPVPTAIRKLLDGDDKTWTGTATELLKRLETCIDDPAKRDGDWPKSPQSLSGLLTRYAPNLREAGIEVTKKRSSQGRLLTLEALAV